MKSKSVASVSFLKLMLTRSRLLSMDCPWIQFSPRPLLLNLATMSNYLNNSSINGKGNEQLQLVSPSIRWCPRIHLWSSGEDLVRLAGKASTVDSGWMVRISVKVEMETKKSTWKPWQRLSTSRKWKKFLRSSQYTCSAVALNSLFFQNDKRFIMFDHVPEQRERWLRVSGKWQPILPAIYQPPPGPSL